MRFTKASLKGRGLINLQGFVSLKPWTHSSKHQDHLSIQGARILKKLSKSVHTLPLHHFKSHLQKTHQMSMRSWSTQHKLPSHFSWSSLKRRMVPRMKTCIRLSNHQNLKTTWIQMENLVNVWKTINNRTCLINFNQDNRRARPTIIYYWWHQNQKKSNYLIAKRNPQQKSPN